VIAAIAVIVFSIVGILTIMGWMPSAMASTSTATYGNRGGATFECAECGVIKSLREAESRDDRGNSRAETVASVAR
jgi:hypothetical protein